MRQKFFTGASMGQSDVTRLLESAGGGDRQALEHLYEAVYAELRLLAESTMRRERAGHTLQPTALVNEAYLKLSPATGAWENRRHLFGAAAQAMRRILVDHARRKQSDKRGAGLERITLSDLDVSAPENDLDVLAVNDALERLAAEDARLSELVTLRFFAGMSIEDTARALDLSPATVKRDWAFARAWLCEQIESSR
jgi:RNA polymerase sigma factor (TIGR02999 family)